MAHIEARAQRYEDMTDDLGGNLAYACAYLVRQGARIRRCQDIRGLPAVTATADGCRLLLIGGDAPVAIDLDLVPLRRVRRNQAAFGPSWADADLAARAWGRISHAETPWPDR